MEDHSIEKSSAVTEATVKVVSSSSGFGKYNVFSCVAKINGQSSRSEHIRKISWGVLINAFVH